MGNGRVCNPKETGRGSMSTKTEKKKGHHEEEIVVGVGEGPQGWNQCVSHPGEAKDV